MIKVLKRRFRKGGVLRQTRNYYLRYRVLDMPGEKWVSLGVTDKQVAEKKARDLVAEREREAAGIVEPKVVRDSAKRLLCDHLEDYLADLTKRERAGRNGRGARLLKSRILRLVKDCGWSFPGEVNADCFIAWRNRQTECPRTLNHYLQGVCAFLN